MLNKNKFLTAIITLSALFLGCFITVVVFVVNRDASHSTLFIILFLLLGIIFASLAAFVLSRFLLRFYRVKNLRKDNEFNLGLPSEFFNLDLFLSGCNRIRKRKNKNKLHYIVAFSASEKKLVLNIDRLSEVTLLNGEVSKILTKLFFLPTYQYSIKNNQFCFDQGLFYLYCVVNSDNEIKNIISLIRQQIFEASEDGKYRILVEPFFGVYKTNKEENLLEAIDNARIARHASEKAFEEMTFYNPSLRRSSKDNDIIELLNALKNDEFIVVYQPKYDLREKRFTSAEALVRWNSPKHGLLSPSRFLPLAESSGLIHELDTLVFKKVCEDLNDTKRRGRRLMPISVNFSLHEFFSSQFLELILNMLDQYKIEPYLIQIEIVESTSQANQFLSISIIKKLQERGIKILMDDFGVGFSNIGNFKKIPFDIIKIDKSFVDNIVEDSRDADMVKFLIQLCKVCGMEVVAEGVDDIKQVELLKKFKCDMIQGYYYSKPLLKAEFDTFLMKNKFETKEARK